MTYDKYPKIQQKNFCKNSLSKFTTTNFQGWVSLLHEGTLLNEDTFACGHLCTATLLHEVTLLHGDSFARGVTFARGDTFARIENLFLLISNNTNTF